MPPHRQLHPALPSLTPTRSRIIPVTDEIESGPNPAAAAREEGGGDLDGIETAPVVDEVAASEAMAPGEWRCGSCMLRNLPGDKCASCDTPKTGAGGASAPSTAGMIVGGAGGPTQSPSRAQTSGGSAQAASGGATASTTIPGTVGTLDLRTRFPNNNLLQRTPVFIISVSMPKSIPLPAPLHTSIFFSRRRTEGPFVHLRRRRRWHKCSCESSRRFPVACRSSTSGSGRHLPSEGTKFRLRRESWPGRGRLSASGLSAAADDQFRFGYSVRRECRR